MKLESILAIGSLTTVTIPEGGEGVKDGYLVVILH